MVQHDQLTNMPFYNCIPLKKMFFDLWDCLWFIEITSFFKKKKKKQNKFLFYLGVELINKQCVRVSGEQPGDSAVHVHAFSLTLDDGCVSEARSRPEAFSGGITVFLRRTLPLFSLLFSIGIP